MSPEMCCKLKALMIIAMMSVAEGHRIHWKRGWRTDSQSSGGAAADNSAVQPMAPTVDTAMANPAFALANGFHRRTDTQKSSILSTPLSKAASRGGAAAMQETEKKETFEFQAEVAKVMDIIINSLYSDKDIFLREIVSNAADACDKKRFNSVTEGTSFDGRIRITADKPTNTITIEDNGIGMSRTELQENLGRIAQSGTKKFQEAIKEAEGDNNLIGQFGVGFYSAFLVADKVSVVTKNKDGPQLRWESESANQYTISEDDSAPFEDTGTRIILTLKEDADKYLDDATIRDMLKKYSEFIQFPIELWAEKTEYEEVPDPDAEVNEGEEPKTKTVPKTSRVWEKTNVAKPLWMRDTKDVNDDEYTEFYKTTFKQYDEPLGKVHFSLEGQVEFRALLFVPSMIPWELNQDMFSDAVKPVKLFVKRVFISDKFSEELLPRWLLFLKGVVDSDDLPLNVSRELLQKSKVLQIIRKRLVRKAIDLLAELSQDEKKSEKLQTNFGRYIKVGLIEDKDNKDAILKIATFDTTNGEKATTLADYKARMKEGQKQIYFVSGASKAAAQSTPVLERLKKKGFEVLLALDQVDEIALQGIGKYEDLEVVDAAKESTKIDESDEEKEAAKKAEESLKATTEFLKEILGKRVDKVIVSNRLTESPSALVQPLWGMSPMQQRFMKAQAAASGRDDMDVNFVASNLEINPDHAVVIKLKEMVDGGDKGVAKQYAELLFDVASISGGYDLRDAAAFAKRVSTLMGGGEDALQRLAKAEEVLQAAQVERGREVIEKTESEFKDVVPEEEKVLETEVL
jgi:heat shock protein beta